MQQLNDDINYIGNNNTNTEGLKMLIKDCKTVDNGAINSLCYCGYSPLTNTKDVWQMIQFVILRMTKVLHLKIGAEGGGLTFNL